MLFACPSLYKKDITPQVLDAHRAWLRAAVAAGSVISAGRRQPAGGGFILLRADSAEAAQAILDADPFTEGGFAEYQVIGYTPTLGAIEG